MSAVLTNGNRKLLKQLRKIGQWQSEGEIIRYALGLVKKEIKGGQTKSLAPFSLKALRQAARTATARDLEDDRRLASASIRFRPDAEP